jgi:hypothetical protein
MRKLSPECVAQFYCPDIMVNSEQELITCWEREQATRWRQETTAALLYFGCTYTVILCNLLLEIAIPTPAH